jgi:hypothetical protein
MSGWGLFQVVLIVVLLVGAGYLIDQTYNHGLRVLFREFLREVRHLIKLEPSLEAVNMLFGIFTFVGLVLLVGAVGASSLFSRAFPENHSIHFPGDMLIVAGLFGMIVFFVLSVAFCLAMRRKP